MKANKSAASLLTFKGRAVTHLPMVAHANMTSILKQDLNCF